jgi:ubiquinone/menaquinone biosynthesis C-methylase UbiE
MQTKEHWENVYTTKAKDSVSWFQEHAETSINLIKEIHIEKNASIIDIGGGASTFVDDLLLLGYSKLSVLDLSRAALEASKARIGSAHKYVDWLVADITKIDFSENEFDIWHDRAVFHFLTEPKDRLAYVRTVLRSVKPKGHVIISTFAEDGPTKCSGLPVMRYSAESLQSEFGEILLLKNKRSETHRTPFGTTQNFIFCHFEKSV